MLYKTELHFHTREVSKCGKSYAPETADFYAAHGYTTVVITNHINEGTWTNKRVEEDQSLWSWERKIDFFYAGYETMVAAAAGRFHVLFGCEFRTYTNPNDYLLYGVTKDFLLSQPELQNMKAKDMIAACRSAGILVVQAHPFRDDMQMTKPELLDGVEVWNGNLGKDNRNDIAELWADRYGLIKTSGTDYHQAVEGKMPVGILTDFPITSNEQLVETLKSGNYTILRNKKSEDGITEVLL